MYMIVNPMDTEEFTTEKGSLSIPRPPSFYQSSWEWPSVNGFLKGRGSFFWIYQD